MIRRRRDLTSDSALLISRQAALHVLRGTAIDVDVRAHDMREI